MEISLKELTLENFKGIKEFKLTLDGKNATIRGDNGTGKSTLFDGFLWLLFGKDSQGQANFEIKTLDGNGVIHGLDHSVEAHLLIDDKPLVLRKTYKEKWTKKRGSANAVLTGHTIDHFIDEVPVKAGEFADKIASLVDEETFKLLTSPTYFNSLHWQRRRDILLSVCGNVSDEAVISSNPDLEPLSEILRERSLEDHQKVLKARKAEINKQLVEIPARIDELTKSLPAEDAGNAEELRQKVWELDKEIEKVRHGSFLPALKKQLADAQADLAELERRHRQAVDGAAQKRRGELIDLRHEAETASREYSRNEREVDACDKELQQLRERFSVWSGKQPNVDNACSTCGQGLPDEQVEAARQAFQANKSQEMEAINERGRTVKAEADKLNERNKVLEEQMKKLLASLEEADQDREPLLSGLEDDISKAQRICDEIAGQINQYVEPDISGLEDEKRDLLAQISEIGAADKTKVRINQLKKDERDLATRYETLEHETHLCERFIVAKVDMLEQKINTKFGMARFKMFVEQVNGGISETCETLYQGVPYHGGLNRGAQTNVGLDIVKTMSEHYGVKAPVFIDNAEAVTKLVDPGTQTIKLIVDEKHKKLKKE